MIKTILIADDNKELTLLFCDYLDLYKEKNHVDFEIIGVAHNGIDAVDLIISNQPDIVLLDIVMPLLDGFGVLEKLGSLKLEKKPKVVMLSGLSDHRSMTKTYDLDAVDFIEKPFDMEKVMMQLSRL